MGNFGIRVAKTTAGCVDRKLWYCSDQDKKLWNCNGCIYRTFQAGTESCVTREAMKGYLERGASVVHVTWASLTQLVLRQQHLEPLRWPSQGFLHWQEVQGL